MHASALASPPPALARPLPSRRTPARAPPPPRAQTSPRLATLAVCARPTTLPRRTVTSLIARAAASSSAPSSPPSSSGRLLSPPVLAAAVAAVAGLGAWQTGWLPVVKAALDASALGTSGALAAFSLVFLSELGDKTFFLAGLLAMRVGRSAALVGSVAALALMTGVSVAIGAAFQAVPTAISSTVNVSHWASVACLVYFGLKTLKAAWETPAGGPALGAVSASSSSSSPPVDLAPELAAAQEELEAAEKSGRVHDTAGKSVAADSSAFRTWARSAVEVGSIIFLAEWGDRSMLATIALAAAQNPAGVAAGAVAGHAVATAIAVVGGVLVARHLSERTVGFIGGGLFLVFAAATLAGWM